MSKNREFKIKIPPTILSSSSDHEALIEVLLKYHFMFKEDCSIQVIDDLETAFDAVTQKYTEVTTKYSKLRKEYGVLYFEGNEFFKRNTLAGLKISKIKSKLEKAKSKNAKSKKLDYEAALNIIEKYVSRYLLKDEE